MEQQNDSTIAFDMASLSINLPPNGGRGLSKCYSGKARSFACLCDVNSVEDLKKQEKIPDLKKRRKYLQRRGELRFSPYTCRNRDSSTSQCVFPFVGVNN